MIRLLDVSPEVSDGWEPRNNLALIVGKKGFIVTTNDFVHWKYSLNEEATFELWRQGERDEKNDDGSVRTIKTLSIFPEARLSASLEELKELVGDEVKADEWGHYFGIKGRVYSNYRGLQKTCKEIEADIDFPEWKEKNG